MKKIIVFGLVLVTIFLVACGNKIGYTKNWETGYGKYNSATDTIEFDNRKCSDDCATFCGQANMKYLEHNSLGIMNNRERKTGEVFYEAVDYGCHCNCQ